MSGVFQALAPKGPIRGPKDQWDVFLSYRSVHRPWVLRLYDQLRHLGYEVFLDQFVLTAGGGLNEQLERHLERSATAVLIWSSRSEESSWCRDEYNALRHLEKSKPGFRYVVMRVDTVELPLFASGKLWVDFSHAPDGPSGAGLLRLLHGLHDTPLSDEAVRLATAYDEALQLAAARVNVARSTGNAASLNEMAKSDAPEWTTTATLPSKAAEALIALSHPADAVPILDATIERFPRSIRPRQLKGLALARMGQWRTAQDLLGEIYELGGRDPETVGMLARTWRDRYAETQELLHLRKARNLYAEAFQLTPTDYYTGVNAATNSVLLGDLGVAESLAAAVEPLVGVVPTPRDYWRTATAGEVQLMRRQYAAAAALYQAAVTDEPDSKGHHESTLAQARRLMERLQPTDEERAAIEGAFR